MSQRMPLILLTAVLSAWCLWYSGLLATTAPQPQASAGLIGAASALLAAQYLLAALLLPPCNLGTATIKGSTLGLYIALLPTPIHSILWLSGALSLALWGGIIVITAAITGLTIALAAALRRHSPDAQVLVTILTQITLCLGLLPLARLAL